MEIIKIIDGSAGRTVTVTGLTQTTITQDNILGIINEGNGKTLYSPINRGNITGVTYSDGTLTITLKDTVTAIAAGDKVLVKLYFEDSAGGDALEATSQQILAAVKNNGTTALAELLSQTHGLAALRTLIAAIPTITPATPQNVANSQSAIAGMLNDDVNGLGAIKYAVGLASKETAATANKQAILNAIAALIGTNSQITLTDIFSLVSSLYGTDETTLTDIYNHVSAVLTALAPKATSQDVSTLAAGYTLATLLTALNGGDSTATLSALNTALTALGTTADGISTKVGSASAGQPATLFAAIETMVATLISQLSAYVEVPSEIIIDPTVSFQDVIDECETIAAEVWPIMENYPTQYTPNDFDEYGNLIINPSES